MKHLLLPLFVAAFLTAAGGCSSRIQPEPKEVSRLGSPESSISSAVRVPSGRTLYWSSGTVPPVVDEEAPADAPERYGDLETQAAGIFERFERQLAEEGMSLEDVVYLRAYVAPSEAGEHAFGGFFDAYARYFGTEDNPVKPARSTVGVGRLVNPAWRIEIEAFAVYPEGGDSSTP